MLTIEIKINGRLVATASARNDSDLADISDYEIAYGERPSGSNGELDWNAHGRIEGHDRRQSVWALVHKIASTAASVAHVAKKARQKMRDEIAAGGGM